MNRRFFAVCSIAIVALASGCASLVTVREEFRLTQAWSGYDRVQIRSSNGSIELTADPASADVIIAGRKQAGGATLGEAESNLAQVEIDVAADAANPRQLNVELRYPDELRSRNIGASMIVSVPAAVEADVNTGNGAIRIVGMRATQARTSNGRITAESINGALSARTSNGRIEVESVDGDVSLETSNGGVTARTIRGSADVETSNGNVELTGISGNVDIETSNGGIVIQASPDDEGRVRLATSNGNIRATLPQSMRCSLDLATSNGSLKTNLGSATLSQANWGKRHLTATLNGGGGGQILARSSNGGVTLECR